MNTFTTVILVPLTIIIASTLGAEFTLIGNCPKVNALENVDFNKFTGIWYTTAVYASDNRSTYDCSIMDFQEDHLGYTLKETFVDIADSYRIQKSYFARIDRRNDLTGNEAKYMVSHRKNDMVLHFPFVILSSDYSDYALAYTCVSKKSIKKQKKHYIFAWILTRFREALSQYKIESILSESLDFQLSKNLFVLKDFTEKTCSFKFKISIETFTDNFW